MKGQLKGMLRKIRAGKDGKGGPVLPGFAGNVSAGIGNLAGRVANAVGGSDLVDYAGSKIAKAMVPPAQQPYVADKTSGWDALKSAGKVGGASAAIAAFPAVLAHPMTGPLVARGLGMATEGTLANTSGKGSMADMANTYTAKIMAKRRAQLARR